MKPAIDNNNETVRELLANNPTPLQLLRRAANKNPDKPALVYLPSADGSEPVSVSYRELLAETESVAASIPAVVTPNRLCTDRNDQCCYGIPGKLAVISSGIGVPV